MIRPALLGILAVSCHAHASAQPLPDQRLNDPAAFEHGFAVSLYHFDACGDPLAGRMFRRALAERFAQCPFSPEAQMRFRQRTRAEQAKAGAAMNQMIEANGGLPRQLRAMSTTCRQQQVRDDYRDLRGRLEQYARGAIPAETIIPAPCDATDIMP